MEALNNFFLPPAKTAIAEQYDTLFWFVHISSLVLTLAIVVAIIYFIIKYRRKSENDVTPVITHNNKLEVTWSVIPLIITLVLFGWGFQTYLDMTTPPDDAYEVNVTAQKWLWRFSYKSGASTSGELHVPAGRPVKLIMQSKDVIHSFYVPDFRIKQDVVPGRYTETWFNAPEPGESIIFCTEYCGTGHSNMMGKVIVQEPDKFEQWLADNSGAATKPQDLAPADWGKQLADEQVCSTCHSVDGSKMTGPTWKGLFGEEQTMSDGSKVTADENYIRESILNPTTKVVEGYQPVMPTFQGQLNDEQVNAIIEYIKTLK